jgi:Major Facilitator Superfamily
VARQAPSAARPHTRLAQHPAARRLPCRSADRRGPGGFDRQHPSYCISATILLAMSPVWFVVQERFVAPPKLRGRGSILGSLIAVATTPALLALFFVLLMVQFGVRTVQPVVTLFVQEVVGARPDLATLSGITFRSPGSPNVMSAPFPGNRSDVIGYRRVLLICPLGATLTTLPQAFTENYWAFPAQRFGVGLFIGGILPTANALVGRLVPSRAHHGLRHHRIGDVSRQLVGATDRRRRRGGIWAALGAPRHRGGAVGEPRMDVLQGARIRGSERLNPG